MNFHKKLENLVHSKSKNTSTKKHCVSNTEWVHIQRQLAELKKIKGNLAKSRARRKARRQKRKANRAKRRAARAKRRAARAKRFSSKGRPVRTSNQRRHNRRWRRRRRRRRMARHHGQNPARHGSRSNRRRRVLRKKSKKLQVKLAQKSSHTDPFEHPIAYSDAAADKWMKEKHHPLHDPSEHHVSHNHNSFSWFAQNKKSSSSHESFEHPIAYSDEAADKWNHAPHHANGKVHHHSFAWLAQRHRSRRNRGFSGHKSSHTGKRRGRGPRSVKSLAYKPTTTKESHSHHSSTNKSETGKKNEAKKDKKSAPAKKNNSGENPIAYSDAAADAWNNQKPIPLHPIKK